MKRLSACERKRLALTYNFTDVWQKRPTGWQQVFSAAHNVVEPEERQARFDPFNDSLRPADNLHFRPASRMELSH